MVPVNNARRRQIRAAIRELQKDIPEIGLVLDILESALRDEEDARDNTVESFQDTDAYNIREESCELLDEAISVIDVDDTDTFHEAIDILFQIDGV